MTGLTGVSVLTGLAMVLAAPVATAGVRTPETRTPETRTAGVETGRGHETTPAQAYRDNPDPGDWIGSYLVDGRQVFCVQFGYKAPDSDERYQPGDTLKTKWGTDLAPDVAADISYLLLRYGNTDNNDHAAALAHLLHSWTSAPQRQSQLDPSNDFRHVAYDIDGHLAKLPASARKAVDTLRTDAAANRGPWTAKVTAPGQPQLIGKAAKWTVDVDNAAGKGVGGVPVTVTLTDATLPGGKRTSTVNTPKDGSPLRLDVTPTGTEPTVSIKLASPADRPVVRNAVDVDTQRVVGTGGEKTLTAKAGTNARTQAGEVRLNKTDAKSGDGISGVTLRLTGEDRTSPAVDQNDKRLVGADGKPSVVMTGDDGVATVSGLRTPQKICLVEIAPTPGYEQGFDPASPPSACGTVRPGETLVLSLSNTPNLPTRIPAGTGGTVHADVQPIAHAEVVSRANPAALAGLGVLLLATATACGLVMRHKQRENVQR